MLPLAGTQGLHVTTTWRVFSLQGVFPRSSRRSPLDAFCLGVFPRRPPCHTLSKGTRYVKGHHDSVLAVIQGVLPRRIRGTLLLFGVGMHLPGQESKDSAQRGGGWCVISLASASWEVLAMTSLVAA
ncbi:hypothetical protein GWK47_054402 [Chionoecetes opilio]|uniref:Uncharacterized protein n=1 Tax=Chionoecetes opilio TaxID=41210 RepID=A0A8J5CQ06_CHIOP|nr:hypothetical protein GWK47_054402 [Chionoecetes opilio]